jgi:hypothetical protein
MESQFIFRTRYPPNATLDTIALRVIVGNESYGGKPSHCRYRDCVLLLSLLEALFAPIQLTHVFWHLSHEMIRNPTVRFYVKSRRIWGLF